MGKFILKGMKKLSGEVEISSAKNTVLPLMAASILCEDKVILENMPNLEDVFVLCDVLKELNSDLKFDINKKIIEIDNKNLMEIDTDSELIKKMRASFLIMGPMISRFGKFKLSLPGGCNIGTRPIDLHLKGFSALGVDIEMGQGFVEAKAKKLIGNNIYLDFPSVGATENILMAAVLAKGDTVIENAATEPEIIDLANMLISMGAIIEGQGTNTIKIKGVEELKGTTHRPIYDRIEAGTFMIIAGITGSKIKLTNVDQIYLRPVIAKLTECNIDIKVVDNHMIVDGTKELKPTDIKTMPFPGFPTDMQSPMMSLLSKIKGTSIISETIFENRFMHVAELKRMGAKIKIDGRVGVIEGVDKLVGATVTATDLRAGAAMIAAGLSAEGETTIDDIYHIDRGYENIENKLTMLGADIVRTN